MNYPQGISRNVSDEPSKIDVVMLAHVRARIGGGGGGEGDHHNWYRARKKSCRSQNICGSFVQFLQLIFKGLVSGNN